MARHSAALAPSLVLGVGAAFDFHAGTKKRAPGWMQRSGLEGSTASAASPGAWSFGTARRTRRS